MDQMFQNHRLQKVLRKEYEDKYGKQKNGKVETDAERADRLHVELETEKDKNFEQERARGKEKLTDRKRLQSFKQRERLKQNERIDRIKNQAPPKI